MQNSLLETFTRMPIRHADTLRHRQPHVLPTHQDTTEDLDNFDDVSINYVIYQPVTEIVIKACKRKK